MQTIKRPLFLVALIIFISIMVILLRFESEQSTISMSESVQQDDIPSQLQSRNTPEELVLTSVDKPTPLSTPEPTAVNNDIIIEKEPNGETAESQKMTKTQRKNIKALMDNLITQHGSIEYNNTPLKEVLLEMEGLLNFPITVDKNIDLTMPIKYSGQEQRIGYTFSELLRRHNLSQLIKPDRIIVVDPRSEARKALFEKQIFTITINEITDTSNSDQGPSVLPVLEKELHDLLNTLQLFSVISDKEAASLKDQPVYALTFSILKINSVKVYEGPQPDSYEEIKLQASIQHFHNSDRVGIVTGTGTGKEMEMTARRAIEKTIVQIKRLLIDRNQ